MSKDARYVSVNIYQIVFHDIINGGNECAQLGKIVNNGASRANDLQSWLLLRLCDYIAMLQICDWMYRRAADVILELGLGNNYVENENEIQVESNFISCELMIFEDLAATISNIAV